MLCNTYALSQIIEKAGDFLATGYLTGKQIALAKEQLKLLFDKVRFHELLSTHSLLFEMEGFLVMEFLCTSFFCTFYSINLSDLFEWVMHVVVDPEKSIFHPIYSGSADGAGESFFLDAILSFWLIILR